MTPEQARLLPFYHDLRNEIVEPDKVVVSTQYFWTKWAPRLGPTLTALVVCLRRHCYYNRATHERRDWCFPEQATLAREIGVDTTKTIRAALQHPLAAHFIRREARYVYDPNRGKKVRTSDMYYVAMDDPLIPEDEALLAVRAAQRLLAEGRGAEVDGSASAVRPPIGQNNPQMGRSKRGRPELPNDRQVPSPTGQLARQDSAVLFTAEVVHEGSTNTTKYSIDDVGGENGPDLGGVVEAFAAANGAPATPAQLARLAALGEQFDAPARQAHPPVSGLAWVRAAIDEAVESGSHFVAPRRIVRICERWAAEGGPAQRDVSPVIAETTPAGPPRGAASAGSAGGTAPRGRGASGARGSHRLRPAPVLPERALPEPAFSEPAPLESPDQGDGVPRDSVRPSESGELGSPPSERSAPAVEPLPSFVVFPELGLTSRPLWQAIRTEARRRATSAADGTLLASTQLLAREDNVLLIGVPGRSAVQRAELRLGDLLGQVARSILARSVEVRFVSLSEWTPTASRTATGANELGE